MDATSGQTFDVPPTFFSSDPSTPGPDVTTITQTTFVIISLSYFSSGESSVTTVYVPTTEILTLVPTFSSDAGSITTPVDTPSSPAPESPVVPSPSSPISASRNISLSTSTTTLSFLTSHLPPYSSTTSPLSSTVVARPSIASNAPNQNSLGTSAKIGIAVGAILGGFAIGLSAFCLGLRLRRKRKSAVDGDMTVYGGKPEKDGNEIFRSEMNGTPMVQHAAELETPTNDLIASPLNPVESNTKDSNQERTCSQNEGALSSIPTSVAQPQQDKIHIRERADDANDDCDRIDINSETLPSPPKEAYDDPQLIQNPWRESRILDD